MALQLSKGKINPMGQVIDINGVLVSSFVVHAFLSVLIIILLRPILTRFRIQQLFWNLPLAEFGILICLLGLFTLLF